MALLVQKYGGTSVADAQRIRNVASRIAHTYRQGHQVVVVVSAMGDTTDQLIDLAREVNPSPDEREMDLLLSTGEVVSCSLTALALKALGVPAISFTGAQAGIWTDAQHRQARILVVEAHRIHQELEKGRVVVVAGFQGVTRDLDVTTLGRGGSDTTAVALAAALGAERCEVYTDVEGVYSADPRLVPQAQKMPEIGYDEMLEMATQGAKVMHPRGVELGLLYNIPILVASSFSQAPGTLLHGGTSMEVRNKVRSIVHDLDVAKVTVVGVPDQPGIAATIFEPLAQAGISVDTIVQNASLQGITDVTFTVSRESLKKALEIVQAPAQRIGARQVAGDARLGKVSIVGTGMQNTPGYAARMFRTLAEEGINIQLITTSEIRITCIIEEARVKDAVRILHRAFELDKV